MSTPTAAATNPKYQTPRVPIQTPMFDSAGNLTRTWVIFFERLGKRESATAAEEPGAAAVEDYEEATFAIYDTTVSANVTNLLSIRRAGTLVDAEIIPKTDTVGDFEFDILRSPAGDPFASHVSIFGTDKLFVPAGTSRGTVIRQAVFLTDPYPLNVDDVLSADILTGGSADIYTAILKWKVV